MNWDEWNQPDIEPEWTHEDLLTDCSMCDALGVATDGLACPVCHGTGRTSEQLLDELRAEAEAGQSVYDRTHPRQLVTTGGDPWAGAMWAEPEY